MDISSQIQRRTLINLLGVGYQTILDYETYGWIPKAKKFPGIKEVHYKRSDVKKLVKILKDLGKLKPTADQNFVNQILSDN